MNHDITICKINRKNKNELDRFLDMPLHVYGQGHRTQNEILKTKKLLNTEISFELFLAYKHGQELPAGRMALCTNPEICDEKGIPYGQIGLFEVIDDYKIFYRMFEFGKSCFKNSEFLLFPFFLSTWHQYRLISKGEDAFSFFLEMPSQPYYKKFVEQYGFNKSYQYNSYISFNLSAVMEKHEEAYYRATANGIRFRPFNRLRPVQEMKIIYDLTKKIFKENNFFTEISFKEFYNYHKNILMFYDRDFYTIALNKENKPIGFCFSPPDYTPLLEELDFSKLRHKLLFPGKKKKARGFIIKTAAVNKKYRKQSVFKAMAYLQAKAALQRGFKYIITALIAKGNPSAKIIGKIDGEKEYKLYELKI